MVDNSTFLFRTNTTEKSFTHGATTNEHKPPLKRFECMTQNTNVHKFNLNLHGLKIMMVERFT